MLGALEEYAPEVEFIDEATLRIKVESSAIESGVTLKCGVDVR